jgi:hypothetical protein
LISAILGLIFEAGHEDCFLEKNIFLAKRKTNMIDSGFAYPQCDNIK